MASPKFQIFDENFQKRELSATLPMTTLPCLSPCGPANVQRKISGSGIGFGGSVQQGGAYGFSGKFFDQRKSPMSFGMIKPCLRSRNLKIDQKGEKEFFVINQYCTSYPGERWQTLEL
ncbi:hypothetical protein [Novosphingobium sp. CECT 9465]|uniref:hypothetical protein n=1 Tax=Novosphingobium sp. CECT 9465 TaxID=2829794 RepID=UPI001E62E058|nr:hypothetical protein [Novosphingobium sp. CECT 9465]